MMKYLRWLLYFIPALLVEIICYATNWFVCLFVRYEIRTDRVKRLDNQQVTMLREYPIRLFNLWGTHDNASDEFYWGKFGNETWTTEEYKSSWWKRYISRVKWLYRNNAYGWLYTYFSTPVEPLKMVRTTGEKGKGFWYNLDVFKSSFQLEAHIPTGKKYFSVNIGWKAHKGFDRKMYANRLPPAGWREYKQG